MEKTIVLVGLMGAGKSTIGKRLAKTLGIEFRDSDDEISEAAGCSISDLFYIHGESIFRDLEKRVLTRLLTDGVPKVLATGGGAWMNAEIRTLTAKHARSVWLKAQLSVLVDRVSRRNTRPLLEQGDKEAILSKMMDERYPFYTEADVTIDSDSGNHELIVTAILRALGHESRRYTGHGEEWMQKQFNN
jgi:shikimate kinase